MQVEKTLADAVINATHQVFSTMAGVHVEPQIIEPWEYYQPAGGISAMIGLFSNNGQTGLMAITFSVPLAKAVICKLLQYPEGKIISVDELCDGTRELVNMISGQTKSTLSDATGNFWKISLPAVIMGPEHQVFNRPKNCPYLLIRFKTDQGEALNLQMTLSASNEN